MTITHTHLYNHTCAGTPYVFDPLIKRVKKIPKPVVIKSLLVYLCKTLGLGRRAEEYRGGPQSICSLFASGLISGIHSTQRRKVGGFIK